MGGSLQRPHLRQLARAVGERRASRQGARGEGWGAGGEGEGADARTRSLDVGACLVTLRFNGEGAVRCCHLGHAAGSSGCARLFLFDSLHIAAHWPVSSSVVRSPFVGKEKRLAEFGSSKQWKTLSSDEAFEQYYLRRRDLEGLPFVAKYGVYDAPRHLRFYVLFDVQDAALKRWGTATAMQEAIAARRAKRARRRARLQPPVLMLLRPVRIREGEINVGSRAVFAAIAGNSGVAAAKLAGWATTGARAPAPSCLPIMC